MAANDLIHDGYLFRKSSILKQYKREWVQLTNNKLLTTFKHSTDNNPSAVYDLTIYNNIRKIVKNNKNNDILYQFEISTTSKKQSQKFKADCRLDNNEWVDYIKYCQSNQQDIPEEKTLFDDDIQF
eukprot:397560_1